MSNPADSLECYLVGGAVRDRLLGRPVVDRDWVVVGTTPERMGELGFRPVGADFPVFLHPTTHEEYALARTERKSAPGYHGFVIHASPEVTIEEDLGRRDLTINAMAEHTDGTLIDPFNGKSDVEKRILRHVSPAFSEDPVRVLRVARFAARFAQLEFSIADETLELMRDLVNSGETEALVAERVWTETSRALDESVPSVYFESLRTCGALAVLLPELDALFGVPQRAEYHPEVDTGVHVMMCIDYAARQSASNRVRYAVLLHDLGKALTPSEELPSHRRHETAGVEPVRRVNERLKVPSDFADLAALVCRHHLKMHQLDELKPRTVNRLLKELGAFRQKSFVEDFALACECDARGRLGLEDGAYPQRAKLLAFAEAAAEVSAADVQRERTDAGHEPLQGKNIGDAIDAARIRCIKQVRENDD